MIQRYYKTYQILLLSSLVALFLIFPDIVWTPYEMREMPADRRIFHVVFSILRYAYFTLLIYQLIKINLERWSTTIFLKRLLHSVLVVIVAYVLYGIISYFLYGRIRHFGSLVLFQFFIVAILSALIGHIYLLYKLQRSKEIEIELLKVENLQSRYDALTNQINPHFFFNSLNGLTSLIRKQNQDATLTYVDKLSDVFRYILRSDKKGLVSLADELDFVRSFAYMMEVRFANKIYFEIAVNPDLLSYQLPVLSILPLLDNIVVHNTIDSLHQMNIRIGTDQADNLHITSPIFPKIREPDTTGTGLKNLQSRFKLLLNRAITIERLSDTFTVILPLNKPDIR